MPGWFKFEMVPLFINCCGAVYYAVAPIVGRPFIEGKFWYWVGASVLTYGLMKL